MKTKLLSNLAFLTICLSVNGRNETSLEVNLKTDKQTRL